MGLLDDSWVAIVGKLKTQIYTKPQSGAGSNVVSANLDKTLHGLQRKTSVSRGLCRKDPTIDG